ncbi:MULTISPECIES: type III secretion system export apparatus subunit SctS [unclassified Sinorhizobium]|uniref:type III secretion system export apparatus subunit SctS n=1 Tax=unclassified Sinorhizobium TaxID=2613772 RepID=UPI0024C416CA|nr:MULTISPECIES: type III secretion system export apparatus subunit SctS [unclassified Sinorhizobium]MDK1378214.1 type III secretion system export apparatus subunit SctS [Sinorhizobium sp. 6-70]MDK1482061.1 type III secretion system export apparatus subunit SctS [Sinorhizobium sp. 6-117]
MNSATLSTTAIEALTLTLVLSMPTILVAAAVGLIVSVLQALTQVQEQTLPFVVKLIGVSLALVVTESWFGELNRYTIKIFDKIGAV